MKQTAQEAFLYQARTSLLTACEKQYLCCIQSVLPEHCLLHAQVNLAAFVDRMDGARFHNELFRNVDFLLTDEDYRPRLAIEINDRSHQEAARRARDRKVAAILEEAGIPLITLWTTYGANPEYISKRIKEALEAPPQRVHHFDAAGKQKKQGCYIATCVYGAYDCPQVWTLRRFRDQCLATTPMGRALIRLYYAVSPHLVAAFGRGRWFRALCRGLLDPFVARLRRQGLGDAPYADAEPPAPRKRL